MKSYSKENLRIGTRIVLVFSIYDEESGDNLFTAPNESMIYSLYKEITGISYGMKVAMESYDPKN